MLLGSLIIGCKTDNGGGCGHTVPNGMVRKYYVKANTNVYECYDYVVNNANGTSVTAQEKGAFTLSIKPTFVIQIYDQPRGFWSHQSAEIVCETYEVNSSNVPISTKLEK